MTAHRATSVEPALSGIASAELPLTIYRNLEIQVRDGTVLRADLWLPGGGRRCPVLLQRTPYDKAFAHVAHARLAPADAVARGYAVMIQDVRGRFASEGTFEPFAHEREDGADTIAWIARQPFSDGRVAMYGASYPGAVQLLAAAAGAAGLAAIVPDVTALDFHGWMYQGGAFQLGFALNWAVGLAEQELARRERTGAHITPLRERLDRLSADVCSAYRRLPVADQPLLNELVPAFAEWLVHPERGVFWERFSEPGDLDHIAVPSLHITGWHDVFVRRTLAQFTRLQQLGRAKHQLLIGPWSHGGEGDALGDVVYGQSASRYGVDLTKVHLDFCDRVLSNAELSPPVRLFTMGANRWRDEDSWPPADVGPHRLYLRADARLTEEPPASDEPTRDFRYDPRDPVPTAGGATFMPGHDASIALGSRDQRSLHARPDVLLYSGEPLAAALEVTGNVALTLHAATSATDTDWTAKLLDVYPDGHALGITDGIVRAHYSQDHPGPLEPGRPYRFHIDVGPTSIVFAAGHRIGVEISSSNFPRFDRNPNSEIAPVLARESDLQVARQQLYHDATHASYLELPVRTR